MSLRSVILASVCWCFCITSLVGQEPGDGPTNEKAQKTFKEASALEQKHDIQWALEGFKKADKQDGGHCLACQKKMIKYGIEMQDWKTAETAAGELIGEAQGTKNIALAHYQLGAVLLAQARDKHKDDLFSRAHEEMAKALGAYANFPDAIYDDGQALAQLKQDDAARARFEQFVKMRSESDPNRQRALRFISQPELARARMAPPFAVTTTEGQRVSLDDLTGKVVLLRYAEGHDSTAKREEGFLDALKAHPEIEVVSSNQYGGADVEGAYKKSEALLGRFKRPDGSLGVDGIFTPNESTTLAMLRVLEDNGWAGKVKFVGFDASDTLAKGLGDSHIDGLVLQDPVNMGYLGVKTMIAHLHGAPVERRVDTGVRLITREHMNDPDAKALLHPDLSRWLKP